MASASWPGDSPCTDFPRAPGATKRESETRNPGPAVTSSAANRPGMLEQTSCPPWVLVPCSPRWKGGKWLLRPLPAPTRRDAVMLEGWSLRGRSWLSCVRRSVFLLVFVHLWLGRAECSPWVWCRADQRLCEYNEIRVFEPLKSRNSFLVFSVSLFCFVFFKKKKGFSPMNIVPHLRKEQCCHWGGPGLASCGRIARREAWGVLVYTGRIELGASEISKGGRIIWGPCQIQILIRKIWGWGIGFCISHGLPGDAVDTGPLAALLVTRLIHPNSDLPWALPETSRIHRMGTLHPDPPY